MRTYDFDRAVMDRLVEMSDAGRLTLPAFTDAYSGGRWQSRTSAPLPPGAGESDRRTFEIVFPGENFNPQGPTWISYDPGRVVPVSDMSGQSWSAQGGGMVRLCTSAELDAGEALSIVAARVGAEFSTNRVISASPRLADGESAPNLILVFQSDPDFDPPQVDDQGKVMVEMEIEFLALPR